MAVGSSDVESWLGSNPEWTTDYFLRKADLLLINKWLLRHGFGTLHEYVNGKDSASLSGPVSPDIRMNGNFNFQRSDSAYNPQRTNSKKHLRHDFARSKTRSIFRTHEATTLGATGKETTLAERRSSLKGMRQFLSLPPTSGIMLSRLIQSKVHLPSYSGKNIDMKRELHAINERDFFFEIVKDISHDLDPKSLTNRILVNVCILLDADRSSLFFVEGDKERRSLVSKVFDIYTGTDCIPTRSGDNIVRIPWGQGILGHVAESGETVNITEASQDPRYKDDLDRMVGYSTDSLLSMPIRSADGDVIGVVQLTNKNTVEGFFTKDDEKVLETYLAFCGMAISTAQAIEAYSREYDRNKALLEVVHDLFEEQTSVDQVVTTIMQRAQSLLKCERCVVMLKEDHCNSSHEPSSFNRLFDIQNSLHNGQKNNGSRNGTSSLSPPSQIAEIVAKTGETVNISDGHTDQIFMSPDDLSSGTNLHTKSLLCKPIRNNKLHTIGVAQLINRLDGKPFDHYDDELFEVFAIFCGLGINNCLLYDQVSRSAAKQAVALEVLSYHAHIPKKDVVTFMTMTPPNLAAWRLDRLDFNDYLLNTDEMVLASIHMFEEAHLLKTFKIEYETLVQWLLTLRKNYRSIAYHNWRHAFNVGQFMFALLETCGLKCHLTDLECLALIVACLCHDLDHRGTNNAFQLKSGSPLMQLYGTEATLEHHHFNHAVMILNSEGHNIFGNLSSAEYTTVMPLLKHAILATDIPLHMQKRTKFFALVEDGNCDWSEPESRTLLRSILMTTCDIATITKPWEVQRKAASLVVAEFFNQGDQERSMFNIQPQEQMDREREDQLPKLQMKWIDGVCLPLYTKLAQFDRQLRPLVANVLDNRENWRKLDEGEVEKSRFKETGV